jgi:UDP-glucose:tetrahydrobiopterin glucosyltransferase
MRIALIAPLVSTIAQPYLGGAQALIADLAQGLTRRGHTVRLFARSESFVPGIAIEQVPVLESVRPADFSNVTQEGKLDPGFFDQANVFLDLFLQLRRRSNEFDVVHAHAFDWPALACSTLLTVVPVVHTLHLPAISPEINTMLRVLEGQGHPLTLVTVSETCARSYAPYAPIDAAIYNGIDLEAIPFSPRVPREAPLLFAGRITPEKGVEAAIDIAEMAGYPLLIAGGIYDRVYYEERIAPRIERAGDRITYLGQLERFALWKVMGCARGLLFPIEWDEPFGLTAVEAMATGTPVIAYRRGAVEEIIKHGATGFLVEPGERAHAAALVDDLFDIPRVYCRDHVEANFSIERMLDGYEKLYTDVVRIA